MPQARSYIPPEVLHECHGRGSKVFCLSPLVSFQTMNHDSRSHPCVEHPCQALGERRRLAKAAA